MPHGVSNVPNGERVCRILYIHVEVVINYNERPFGPFDVTKFEHDLKSAFLNCFADILQPKPVIALLDIAKSILVCVPVIICLEQSGWNMGVGERLFKIVH